MGDTGKRREGEEKRSGRKTRNWGEGENGRHRDGEKRKGGERMTGMEQMERWPDFSPAAT